MRILIATFCDAGRAQGDRLDVLGAGVRVFFTPFAPVELKVSLATLVSTDETEIGTKQKAYIRFFDADMSQIGEIALIYTTWKADRPGIGTQFAKVTPLKIMLPKAGTYLVRIAIGDEIVTEWPIELRLQSEDAAPFRTSNE